MARTIWIVDDDADIRESLQLLLEGEGYEVRSLADGEAVLAALREAPPPEVMLLDHHMPRMGGEELRAALGADARWSKLKIIFCSGDRPSEETRRNVFAVLEKPFDVDRMFALVKSAFN